MAIGDTIKECDLTQQEAAQLCGTDQPTLSKVLRGRMGSVTIDKPAAWLNALGRTVEIRVRPYDHDAETGRLVMASSILGCPLANQRCRLRVSTLTPCEIAVPTIGLASPGEPPTDCKLLLTLA